MSAPTSLRPFSNAGTVVAGSAVVAVSIAAWFVMVRDASSMSMPENGAGLSVTAAVAFTARWGVMMVAMMLPSAAPMVLLYRTVSRRLAAEGDRVLPFAAFGSVYLLLWMAIGVPVYVANVAIIGMSLRWPAIEAATPYTIGGVLIVAGIYQLTGAKRACLRHCESPLGFLMRRFKSGYLQTTRLAVEHAGYCIGCCWGLMMILVVAGAMSMAWVVVITVVVFAEKVLPPRWKVWRLAGVSLILLGTVVMRNPDLAFRLRPRAMTMGVK